MAKKQKPVIVETVEAQVFQPVTEFDFSNSVTTSITTSGQPTRASLQALIHACKEKIDSYLGQLAEIERNEKIRALEKQLEALKNGTKPVVSSPVVSSPVVSSTTIDNQKVFKSIQANDYAGLNSSEKTLALKLSCIARGFEGKGKSGLNCLNGWLDKPVDEIINHAKNNGQTNQIPLIKRYLKMRKGN